MEQVLTDPINDIINNLKSDNSKFKKENNDTIVVSEKILCPAAVKLNTIGSAYKNILDGIDVYLVKEEINGVIKKSSYSRCSKILKNNDKEFCHIHCKMLNENNDKLKIFEKDILPSNSKDKTRILASINDDYFSNMGKRGAKKKNSENIYYFEKHDNPIKLILEHKNVKLRTILTAYAMQLLKNNSYVEPLICESIKNNSYQNNIKDDIISELDNDENEESESNYTIDSSSESNEESFDSDEESLECIEIYTTKNKLYYLNSIDNLTVYEKFSEDGGEDIGKLHEISEDYHTIFYENKFYTVIKEITVPKCGKINCCVITDSLFDTNFNFIGTRTKTNNNKYNFNFI